MDYRARNLCSLMSNLVSMKEALMDLIERMESKLSNKSYFDHVIQIECGGERLLIHGSDDSGLRAQLIGALSLALTRNSIRFENATEELHDYTLKGNIDDIKSPESPAVKPKANGGAKKQPNAKRKARRR